MVLLDPNDIAQWWLNTSDKNRQEFLSLVCDVSDSIYPVSDFTWYAHPAFDDKKPAFDKLKKMKQ